MEILNSKETTIRSGFLFRRRNGGNFELVGENNTATPLKGIASLKQGNAEETNSANGH